MQEEGGSFLVPSLLQYLEGGRTCSLEEEKLLVQEDGDDDDED
jgi:hypothetical protein